MTETEIVIVAILLLLAILTPMCNPFFRVPDIGGTDDSNEDETDKGGYENFPPLSVVVLSHDNAQELKQSIESFLSQDYPAGFEVIIVADKSDSETEDVVKIHSANNNLYATYIPTTARYLSRKKLAVTLGVKAAHNDWVVITDAYCYPDSQDWLKSFAKVCTDDNDVIQGYTQFEDETGGGMALYHARKSCYELKSAERGNAFASFSHLVAVRKKIFLQGDGFVGNLKLLHGEFDFIINKFSDGSNTGIASEKDSWLREMTPSHNRWKKKLLNNINVFKSLERTSGVSALSVIDSMSMHLCNLCILAAVIWASLMQNWILLGAACTAFVIEYIFRCIIASKALRKLGVNVFVAIVPLWEFFLWIHSLCYLIKYRFADKKDFISHKQ